METHKKLIKDLEEIHKRGMKNFYTLQVNEANLLTWHGLIVSDNTPYDKRTFRTEINFPTVYPLKPPEITFKNAEVCLPVIGAEN